MEKYQPVAVLHFAGFAYVGESVQKPDKYYRNNVVGSLTLLESIDQASHSQDRVFIHLLNLWRSAVAPDIEGSHSNPRPSLRTEQAYRRKNAAGL